MPVAQGAGPDSRPGLSWTWDLDLGALLAAVGGECRRDHKLKQTPGWMLIQPAPGHFQLTTPAGRIYTTTPDPYP